MQYVGWILSLVIWLYLMLLIARMFISFLPLLAPDWQPAGLGLVALETIYSLTDPPLKILGKYLPPLRIGNIALDMGFIVLYLGVLFLQRLVGLIF